MDITVTNRDIAAWVGELYLNLKQHQKAVEVFEKKIAELEKELGQGKPQETMDGSSVS